MFFDGFPLDVERFVDWVLFKIGVSESLVSKLAPTKVNLRRWSARVCSTSRICFKVPARRSSTLSLIAAEVSTSLQRYLIAACRATKFNRENRRSVSKNRSVSLRQNLWRNSTGQNVNELEWMCTSWNTDFLPRRVRTRKFWRYETKEIRWVSMRSFNWPHFHGERASKSLCLFSFLAKTRKRNETNFLWWRDVSERDPICFQRE